MTITDSTSPYPQTVARTLSQFPLFLYQLGWGTVLNWIPFLVMTTQERQSGKPHHIAIEYRRHGSKYYIVAGWGDRTDWYQNLMHNPHVTIQHGSHVHSAKAHLVENPAEALRALYMFSRNSWIYESLFARMSSAESADLSTLAEVVEEFTVVRIDPIDEPLSLPTVPLFSEPTRKVASGFALLMGLWIMVSLLRRTIRRK